MLFPIAPKVRALGPHRSSRRLQLEALEDRLVPSTTDATNLVSPSPPTGPTQDSRLSTATSLVASTNPSLAGQSVTFTATVTGPQGTEPSGVVIFLDGSTSLGQGALSTSGGATTATFATSNLSPGSHSMAAYYTGDSNDRVSVGRLTQMVNTAGSSGGSGGQVKNATSTSLVASANPALAGQSVTFTATVTGRQGTEPTGVVVFLDGSTSIGQGTLSTSGGTTTASFSTSSLTPGSHNIAAYYTGDSSDAVSVGRLTEGVNQEGATTLTVGTPNQRFVVELYVSLLERQPDAGGLAAWTAVLDQGVSRTQAALAIQQSHESRGNQVEALYERFLHRKADSSGLDTYVAFLFAGGTLDEVRIILTSSSEYLQARGGGTNNGFLTALYEDALNRSPDAGGLATFAQALDQGLSPRRVAAAIFSSTEQLQDLIADCYQQFLKRAADNGGLSTYVQAMQAGASDQSVIALLLGSDEFFTQV